MYACLVLSYFLKVRIFQILMTSTVFRASKTTSKELYFSFHQLERRILWVWWASSGWVLLRNIMHNGRSQVSTNKLQPELGAQEDNTRTERPTYHHIAHTTVGPGHLTWNRNWQLIRVFGQCVIWENNLYQAALGIIESHSVRLGSIDNFL